MEQTELLPATAASLIVLGLLVALVCASGFRRVRAPERLVVRRSGRTVGVRGPGLRFLLPFVDTGVRVPMDARPHDIWLKATTRDGVPVRVKALAVMRVDDPVRYAATADASSAAQTVVELTLRDLIAGRDLVDMASLLKGGDDAGPPRADLPRADLLRRVNEALRPGGMAATLVEVTDALVPVRADLSLCRCETAAARSR
ncbi:SPFH domain/Band 7 family protein [Actinomadura hallensis]|uniref:SPFH domain/Band 7 family protein n=1 Tax=Actinomadura hallensis TaxID=337895 RepID=A0A543ILN0_9ACTN|nr:SPFH domain-containing protein [Actinomadura hallensis]TQM71481.1 SPFH domain/Band 7 family protein [Actinomadura hallensis]